MQFIQTNWMLVMVLVLSGAMLVWPLIRRRFSPVKEVGNLVATRLLNAGGATLIDVREAQEYADGHLPNAVHLPLSELGSRTDELAKMKGGPVIVYCARGQRGRSAADALAKQGFTEVYNLTGGFRGWKDAGLPVDK
jgi:rhodanese-related sulfurtransferase